MTLSRIWIVLSVVFVSFLLSASTPFAADYYVSNSGDDGNSGTSVVEPWRTISKVNSFSFSPGDTIHFRKGDVWREQLIPRSGTAQGYVTYTSYGRGDKPLLLGSIEKNSPDDWINEGGNIWSAEPRATGSELLANPSFDTDTSNWFLYAGNGAVVTGGRDGSNFDSPPGGYRLQCTDNGAGWGSIQLYAPNISIHEGKWYRLSFRAKCTAGFTLPVVNLINPSGPLYSQSTSLSAGITTDWTTFTVYYEANKTASDARIAFFLGNVLPDGSTFYIDTLSFREVAGIPCYFDVGNIIFNNGETCGIRVWGEADLDRQNEFWYDATKHIVKVYSSENPALLYDEIECALTRNIIEESNRSFVVYEDLHLAYGAAHGIDGGSTDHIVVRNCDLCFIGGGRQATAPPGAPDPEHVRFGNGVQFWNSATNNLVEGCNIWEIYDTGLTHQGNQNNNVQSNITYRNNNIWNCEYSFEFWSRPINGQPDMSIMRDIWFENNICVGAGGGWSHGQRPDPSGRHLCAFTSTAQVSNFYIRNNTFIDAEQASVWFLSRDGRTVAFNGVENIDIDYNTYRQTSPQFAFWGTIYSTSDFGVYQSNTGKDTHSKLETPDGIRVSLVSIDLDLATNNTCQLAAILVFSNGSTVDLTTFASYSSSDPTVATVSPTGVVTASGSGQAQITVAYEGLAAVVPVTVEPAVTQNPIVIDHTCTDILRIPDEWIDTVQAGIKLHYAHTSHGSQLTTGLDRIELADPKYDTARAESSLPAVGCALCIFDGQEYDAYITHDEYWSTEQGRQYTRNVLDHNPDINVSGWSWCVQLNSFSEAQVQDYLDTMAAFEAEYPDVIFIYMTGNAQATGADGYNRHLRNEQIRNWVRSHPEKNRVLFDFADLDSWGYNPGTSQWEQATYEYWNGSEFVAVPVEHPQFHGDQAGHTTYASCEQKGRALWWMLAMLAGWDPSHGIDLPTVTVETVDGNASEPGTDTAEFTVSRTGSTTASLTVNYSVGGTAVNGTDYKTLSGFVTIPAGSSSANIVVTPIDDALVEGSETVIVTLSASASYSVGSPSNATLTIDDNDVLPTVTIVATDANASEPGTDTGTFTVSRTGSTTSALTVNYSVGGTAVNGTDYKTLSGSVTIPAGSSSANIVVTPIDDAAVEPDETVIVTIAASASYTIGSPSSATVTIADNDTIDTTPPTGTVIINGGAAYTTSTSVTLTLSATDNVGVTQMRFSNNGINWGPPGPAPAYATTRTWTLDRTNGTKTVYAKFKDAAGNWSTPATDTIVLDTVAPVTTASPAGGTYKTAKNVSLTATDATSGPDKIYYTTDGTKPTVSSPVYSGSITISSTTTLKYRATDKAGNIGAVKTQTYTINHCKIYKETSEESEEGQVFLFDVVACTLINLLSNLRGRS